VDIITLSQHKMHASTHFRNIFCSCSRSCRVSITAINFHWYCWCRHVEFQRADATHAQHRKHQRPLLLTNPRLVSLQGAVAASSQSTRQCIRICSDGFELAISRKCQPLACLPACLLSPLRRSLPGDIGQTRIDRQGRGRISVADGTSIAVDACTSSGFIW
jgi:hypothetical protein